MSGSRLDPAWLAGAGIAVLLALVPVLGLQEYWVYTLTISFYYALLASSWSLLVGYIGRISFAQAAMAGLGAYVSVLAVTRLGVPIAAGITLAFVVTGLTGVFIGWLSLRLHGPYLGLTTIAFAEILRIAITAEHGFTRGSLGLKAPAMFPDAPASVYYYAMFALLGVSLLVMWLMLRSRLGLFFRSIREDEDGAASLGVRVTAWKVFAFAASSAFAGLAGSFYAHHVQLIAPSMMSLQEMGFVLTMAVVGGFHNVFYAALGGIGLHLVIEALRGIGEWRLAGFGLIAILMLRFAPNGLVGIVVAGLTPTGRNR
jgi:branched-chain amino acid transport system permease protein